MNIDLSIPRSAKEQYNRTVVIWSKT